MGIVRRLSAEEIMKIAKVMLIQNMPNHVFGLSHQETTDVELACLLLASAEKIARQEFDEGIRLLNLCDFLSSKTGTSVQRTVHYFTKALQERIDRETGRNAFLVSKEQRYHHSEETMAYGNPTVIACFLHLPFSQVTQFAGIQAITESVTSVKRVHYIDLAIRSGSQCIVLMQALATRHECPIELLKITAGGTSSKQRIEETGEGLARFAEALNLPFSFQIIMVTDIKDLNKDMFETKADEVVAIYSNVLLNYMIMKPSRLESLLKVVRDINPRVIVVVEADADHN